MRGEGHVEFPLGEIEVELGVLVIYLLCIFDHFFDHFFLHLVQVQHLVSESPPILMIFSLKVNGFSDDVFAGELFPLFSGLVLAIDPFFHGRHVSLQLLLDVELLEKKVIVRAVFY